MQVLGVTGARTTIGDEATQTVRRIKVRRGASAARQVVPDEGTAN